MNACVSTFELASNMVAATSDLAKLRLAFLLDAVLHAVFTMHWLQFSCPGPRRSSVGSRDWGCVEVRGQWEETEERAGQSGVQD